MKMANKIVHSTTIFVVFLSTLATTLDQISAFSTSSNHGRTNVKVPSQPSLVNERQQRIEAAIVKHNGDSRLFADAFDTPIKSADKQDDGEDAVPVDHAETTAQFLAGLWKLIAKGNHMVRGVSSRWWCTD